MRELTQAESDAIDRFYAFIYNQMRLFGDRDGLVAQIEAMGVPIEAIGVVADDNTPPAVVDRPDHHRVAFLLAFVLGFNWASVHAP